MSNSNNDYKREERRKASFALAHASTYILALSLLAAGGFAVIMSPNATPMTAAIAQELDNNNTITTTGQPGGGPESSACTPTQIGGGSGGSSQNTTTTTNATTATMGGSDANATARNATSTAGGGVTPSTSEVRDFIEQACIALEVGDIEGALIQLNLALGQLGGDSGDGTQGNNTDTQSEITGGTATSGGGGALAGGGVDAEQ